MKAITQDSCERAWLDAAEHLAAVPGHADYNLVVEISKPAAHDAADRRLRSTVDRFLRAHKANPLSTVAGTIFPVSEYRDYGLRGVYEVYPDEVYPEIKDPKEWGRYAHRLVRWTDYAGKTINPLKTVVEKMVAQIKNGCRMRACYELSLTDSGIDLPLYDPTTDAGRTRSGPCLSHVSLKIGVTNSLYLTAIYRSHSYIARALGNFYGLAALQAFVCDQTELTPGPLLSVSSYARLDADDDWSVREALQLVKDARAASDGVTNEAAWASQVPPLRRPSQEDATPATRKKGPSGA